MRDITSKPAMRRVLREHRRNLSPAQQCQAALALLETVADIPNWNAAKRIAIYLPFDGEIDTAPLIDFARSAGKLVHLPIVNEDKSLKFAQWRSGEKLVSNRFNILEPATTAACSAAELIEFIFLPLVAWDRHGNRLGMGGGYYDRALAEIRQPLRVGLAHTCQQVELIAREEWDVTLDYVATDTALHACNNEPRNI